MNKKTQIQNVIPGPLFDTEGQLLSWLDNHKGKQIRIPVYIPQGTQDVFLGFQNHHKIFISDLRMGMSFSMHVRAIRQTRENLFLWLDGYWDVKGILPFPHTPTDTKTFELHNFVGIIPPEKRELVAFFVHCL